MIQGSSLLLQESDPDLRRVIAESLEQAGWQVVQVHDQEEALSALQDEPLIDVLILEFQPSNESTRRLVEGYRTVAHASAKVVLTTDDRLANEWRRLIEPDGVIYKPFDIRHLVRSIESLAQPNQV